MAQPEKKTVYVTREIERALGATPDESYLVVTNRSPYGEKIQKEHPESVFLLDPPAGMANDPRFTGAEPLGTGALIEHLSFKALIDALASKADAPNILVFKNTARIEPLIQAGGWHLLNPKASLSEEVENKMSQIEWLGDLGVKYLPEHFIRAAKDIRWEEEPFIVQWGHGHTGDGTMLISSAKELAALQEKFPRRMARVSAYVRGPSFTVNAVVASDKVLISTPSYQITGLPSFTANPFSTIGNDWSATHTFLSNEEVSEIEAMALAIGTKLNISGWRGLFGLDVMRDDERGRIVLIEINARQPASTTFESQLQTINRKAGIKGLTTFEAHIKALRGEHIDEALIPLNDGSQIVQRVTAVKKDIPAEAIAALEKKGYTVISYPNAEENADLVRIQSSRGIMEGHGKLNARGKEISEALGNPIS